MWSKGVISSPTSGNLYEYCVKHYEEPSDVYGIDDGRISKLCIRRHGNSTDIVAYERGWCVEVPDDPEVQAVYKILLAKYN